MIESGALTTGFAADAELLAWVIPALIHDNADCVLMKLTFLGTRGEIEARTRRHHMHSSRLVSYRGKKVMIDCGLDWLGKFEQLCAPNSVGARKTGCRARSSLIAA